MRRTAIFTAFAMLAACGRGGDSTNGAAASAGAANDVAAALALQPGLWETRAQFTTIDAPGLPADMAETVRQGMSEPRNSSFCVAAETPTPPPGAWAAVEDAAGASCRFEPNGMAGGAINVRGACTSRDGSGEMQMTITGRYTATTMEAVISRRMSAPPGMPVRSIRLEGQLMGRRTRDCNAPVLHGNGID